MDGFFTWQGLLTCSDATLATAMITQLLKETGFLKRFPTRALSLIVALTILFAATFMEAGPDASKLLLAVINSFVVALASNGAFDAVNRLR